MSPTPTMPPAPELNRSVRAMELRSVGELRDLFINGLNAAINANPNDREWTRALPVACGVVQMDRSFNLLGAPDRVDGTLEHSMTHRAAIRTAHAFDDSGYYWTKIGIGKDKTEITVTLKGNEIPSWWNKGSDREALQMPRREVGAVPEFPEPPSILAELRRLEAQAPLLVKPSIITILNLKIYQEPVATEWSHTFDLKRDPFKFECGGRISEIPDMIDGSIEHSITYRAVARAAAEFEDSGRFWAKVDARENQVRLKLALRGDELPVGLTEEQSKDGSKTLKIHLPAGVPPLSSEAWDSLRG